MDDEKPDAPPVFVISYKLWASRFGLDPTIIGRTFTLNDVPTTLSDPDPPTWDYVMLENHPTIMQRLAMAEAWRRRYATSSAQVP